MFHTMERLDGVDLGTPGPLVHTLESWRGGYEEMLVQSVRRKPTPLSVWMVNRILNAHSPNARHGWNSSEASPTTAASAETKAEANRFITYQKEKGDPLG